METLTCPKCSSTDYSLVRRGIHQTAYCSQCGGYIKNIIQDNKFLFPYGKHKNTPLSEMTTKPHISYLLFQVEHNIANNSLKNKIYRHLVELESSEKLKSKQS